LLRHVFPGKEPPANASWAYIDAPMASVQPTAQSSADDLRAYVLAEWEARLVGGALRDDFCSAGGRPLVGWSVSKTVINGGVSDGTFALNQHFPNLSPTQFRSRLALVGKRFGFEVGSVRLLRPRQLAPIVVVRTRRDRRDFITDVPAIIDLLNPKSISGHEGALTFEGFFFEARDPKGAFVRVDSTWRGEVGGGQWSAYPYQHG